MCIRLNSLVPFCIKLVTQTLKKFIKQAILYQIMSKKRPLVITIFLIIEKAGYSDIKISCFPNKYYKTAVINTVYKSFNKLSTMHNDKFFYKLAQSHHAIITAINNSINTKISVFIA